LVWLPRARKRASDFVAFLEQLAQAYPVGELVLVMDNVITHDAKLVRQWLAGPDHARCRVLWLPQYSAHEHNPIEREWGLLKDAVAADGLHGSIDELVTAAEHFFATTALPAPTSAVVAAEALRRPLENQAILLLRCLGGVGVRRGGHPGSARRGGRPMRRPLRTLLEQLHLQPAAERLDRWLARAAEQALSVPDCLAGLLEEERVARQTAETARRLRQAHFPFAVLIPR
jgi:hypothetical protein